MRWTWRGRTRSGWGSRIGWSCGTARCWRRCAASASTSSSRTRRTWPMASATACRRTCGSGSRRARGSPAPGGWRSWPGGWRRRPWTWRRAGCSRWRSGRGRRRRWHGGSAGAVRTMCAAWRLTWRESSASSRRCFAALANRTGKSDHAGRHDREGAGAGSAARPDRRVPGPDPRAEGARGRPRADDPVEPVGGARQPDGPVAGAGRGTDGRGPERVRAELHQGTGEPGLPGGRRSAIQLRTGAEARERRDRQGDRGRGAVADHPAVLRPHMVSLESLRGWVYRVLHPVTDLLAANRVHPNLLTTLGFLVTISSGIAFHQHQVRVAGFLILLGGLFDILDGRVARLTDLGSKFGAF